MWLKYLKKAKDIKNILKINVQKYPQLDENSKHWSENLIKTQHNEYEENDTNSHHNQIA